MSDMPISHFVHALFESSVARGSLFALFGLAFLLLAPIAARFQARLTAGGDELVRSYTVLARIIGGVMVITGVVWLLGLQ